MELTYQVLRTQLKSDSMGQGDYYALLPFWTKDKESYAYIPTFRTKEEAIAFIQEESFVNSGNCTILEVYQKYPAYTN